MKISTRDQIAQRYLNARQKFESMKGKNLEKIQDTINKLEEAKRKLPETSLLRSKLEEQITKLKKQTEECSELEKKLDNSRQQLLKFTAASFEIDPLGDKALSKNYIKAITDTLFKRESTQLEFHNCIVKPNKVEIQGDNTQVLIVCANISEFVQEAAKKILGKSTLMDKLWNRINNAETMFKVYSILATNDMILTAAEIASLINEEGWDKEKINYTLVNLLRDNLFTHKLIRRVEEGKYQVSNAGCFLWLEFGPPRKEESEKELIAPTSRIPPQAMLNDWSKS